jgi:hypothetical protein
MAGGDTARTPLRAPVTSGSSAPHATRIRVVKRQQIITAVD